MKSLGVTARRGVTGPLPGVRALGQRWGLTPPFTVQQLIRAMETKPGPAQDEPWFDPTRTRLPSYDEQTAGLTPETLNAQRTARVVQNLPVTGLPLEAPFDLELAALVREGALAGISFSIAIGRELAVTRGYGYLCTHDKVVVEPTHPGYLGSITKPLCAMAALTLVRAGKLRLDQRVVDILPLTPLAKDGERRQPEIDRVTVRMLMNHTSGLFNAVEPLFDRDYYKSLARMGTLRLVNDDISQYDLVRRGMVRPFVSQPGEEYHYSGQGLQVLGRVIEKISGQRLDKYIDTALLRPLGVGRHATMSYLSRDTLLPIYMGLASKVRAFIPTPKDADGKAASWRFDRPNASLYGDHWGHADSCGASMLSSLDLLRFLCFFPVQIGPEMMTEMVKLPMVRNAEGKMVQSSNGLGWGVSHHGGAFQYGHGGAFGGIRAFCESTSDDVQYAVVAAGEDDARFERIRARLPEIGREFQRRGTPAMGWRRYGYPTTGTRG
jgi:CubicO group peptidase (beta-lactamase class C family)